MTDNYANTNFKDSVFIRYLAEDDARLVEIYNAVVGTNYPLDTKVQKNTLTDVLYKDRINDLSFTLDGHTLVLFEHQSTINENMALRLLIYIARLYEKDIRMRDGVSIYQRKQIPLPVPKFVVLYNGKEPLPEHSTWKLSDAYMVQQENPTLELNVEVYNINYSEKSELLQRSEHLHNYSYFIHLVHEAKQQGKNLSEAIKDASARCIEQNRMKMFLQVHAAEVEKMLITEWDWDEAMEVERQEGREEGMKQGIEKGIEQGIEQTIRAFGDLLAPEQIAEKLNLPLEYVLGILKS